MCLASHFFSLAAAASRTSTGSSSLQMFQHTKRKKQHSAFDLTGYPAQKVFQSTCELGVRTAQGLCERQLHQHAVMVSLMRMSLPVAHKVTATRDVYARDTKRPTICRYRRPNQLSENAARDSAFLSADGFSCVLMETALAAATARARARTRNQRCSVCTGSYNYMFVVTAPSKPLVANPKP